MALTTFIIIFIVAFITALAGFLIGFFCGVYQKREGAELNLNPLPRIKEKIEERIPEKSPNYTPAEKKELDKVNTFYGEREL